MIDDDDEKSFLGLGVIEPTTLDDIQDVCMNISSSTAGTVNEVSEMNISLSRIENELEAVNKNIKTLENVLGLGFIFILVTMWFS